MTLDLHKIMHGNAVQKFILLKILPLQELESPLTVHVSLYTCSDFVWFYTRSTIYSNF